MQYCQYRLLEWIVTAPLELVNPPSSFADLLESTKAFANADTVTKAQIVAHFRHNYTNYDVLTKQLEAMLKDTAASFGVTKKYCRYVSGQDLFVLLRTRCNYFYHDWFFAVAQIENAQPTPKEQASIGVLQQ